MSTNPTKSVTVADGDTEVVYFENGYPRCGSMRADVTSTNGNTVNFDFGVSTDDDVTDSTTFSDFEVVHQAAVEQGTDSYTGAGTTAMGRSVAVQVENVATGTDGVADDAEVTVELHNSSDPAENDHGFAYANTYREDDRK